MQIHFSKFDILFGYQNTDRNRVPLNVILLTSKKCMYDINRKNGILNLMALKQKFQQTCFDEYYLAVLIDKQDFFYPTAFKGCRGIVFTHGVRMGGRAAGNSLFGLYLRNRKV